MSAMSDCCVDLDRKKKNSLPSFTNEEKEEDNCANTITHPPVDSSLDQECEDGDEVKDTQSNIGLVLVIFEIVMIILFGIFAKYKEYDNEADATMEIAHYYPFYQDVNVMIYVGFGFLMSFLEHYSFGALGYTIAVSAVTVQTSMVVSHMMHCLFVNEWKMMELGVVNLITSNFAIGATLVSFGVIIGRATSLQLVLMAISETVVYSLNETIGIVNLEVVDMGGSMFVHLFGAVFGLAVSYTLSTRERNVSMLNDRTSNKSTDTIAMIGTLFLFMFWPSFNGALAKGTQKHRVMINTVLALAASCVSTISASLHVGNGKIDIVHIQNSILAGGVAVGSACDLVIQPWAAIAIGLIAGGVSVAGYYLLTPFLEERYGLMDTCGVLNLHGVPGLIGAIGGGVSAWVADDKEYGASVTMIWPARDSRTALEQASYQILAGLITILLGSAGGIFTGHLMSYLPQRLRYYQDTDDWKHE